MSMLNYNVNSQKCTKMYLPLLKCQPLLNIRKLCLPLLTKPLLVNNGMLIELASYSAQYTGARGKLAGARHPYMTFCPISKSGT